MSIASRTSLVIAAAFAAAQPALAQPAPAAPAPKPAPAPAVPAPKPAPAPAAPAAAAPAPAAPASKPTAPPPQRPAPAATPAALPQPVPVLVTPAPATPAAAPPAATPPSAAPAPPAPAAPAPAAPPPPAVLAVPAPPQEVPLVAEREDEHAGDDWYESLDVSAFVDTYFAFNFNGPKPQDRNALRAYDRSNGFGISWAALDVAYASDSVGATVNLRFGPTALVYSGNDDEHGLQFVKQAYATWKPLSNGKLTLDFGKWESIYGLEVSDSQHDINYTRGLLYTLAQPFFFTGLRASYDFDDAFTATLLAVNGWNNSLDNNLGKSFGGQVVYKAPRSGGGNLLTAKLGYVVGPENNDYLATCPAGTEFVVNTVPTCTPVSAGAQPVLADRASANSKFRHLVDLVVQFEPTDALTLAVNADYGHDTRIQQLAQGPAQRSVDWWGVAVEGRYGFNEVWAAGLRGEYVGDPDGAVCGLDCAFWGVQKLKAYSGTVTIDAAPANHLLVRLDGRVDAAAEDVFPKVHTANSSQWTLTLGVVATTN